MVGDRSVGRSRTCRTPIGGAIGDHNDRRRWWATAPSVVPGPAETPIGGAIGDHNDRRRWYWQPWLRDRPGRAAEGGSAERLILAAIQIGRPIGTGRARRPRRLVARSLVDHSGNLW